MSFVKNTHENLLHALYFNNKSGFRGLNNFISSAREFGIDKNEVKEWYKKQSVNQILVTRRNRIAYHKIIGDGDGYQADIIFIPNDKENDGYIGMLTFINTATRRAYVALIKNRSTEELLDKIEVWIDHVDEKWGTIKSIATDNEFYNNTRINDLFSNNRIRHYVEVAGTHSKLGIINRFHRTIRDL